MNLTICNTDIRQLDGLFSLNDLHRASGNEERHKPFRFMRLDQTKDRIDNERGYEPGNCRWATRSEQNKNRRPWKIKKK